MTSIAEQGGKLKTLPETVARQEVLRGEAEARHIELQEIAEKAMETKLQDQENRHKKATEAAKKLQHGRDKEHQQ
jgi:hypothetical protein